MYYASAIFTTSLHLGLGNNKDIDVSLCKDRIYVEPLVTVSAHQHVPRTTSVLVGSKPDISKALPILTKIGYMDILNVEPLVTVSAHQHVPRTTSVLVCSKPDISKALPILTRVPICHCYHRSHETMVALLKYGLNISKIGISFGLLPLP